MKTIWIKKMPKDIKFVANVQFTKNLCVRLWIMKKLIQLAVWIAGVGLEYNENGNGIDIGNTD